MSNQELELLLKKFMADESTADDRQLLRHYLSLEEYRTYAKDWIEQMMLVGTDAHSAKMLYILLLYQKAGST